MAGQPVPDVGVGPRQGIGPIGLPVMKATGRQKKQRELLEGLKKGDKVITSSGIWGTVTNLDKETATLQVADNTKIRLQRDHISSIRTSSES